MAQNGNQTNTSIGLNGLEPLAYMGVNPSTPPQLVIFLNPPTTSDGFGFNIGTLWLTKKPSPIQIFMLVSKAQGMATWKRLYPPGLETLTTDDLTVVMPTDDTIVIHGDNNINTDGSNAPGIVTINLNNSILLPATTGPTVGVIALGTSLITDRFLHNFGDDNCFVGNSSGNFSLTGSRNTGTGTDVLDGTTSGSSNCGYGFESLFSLTSGDNNSAFGYLSAGRITSGDNNLALGVAAGAVYSTESSNVVIANSGMSGDQNTIRIGTQGTGSAQQNVAYMAGITGTTIANPTAAKVVNVGTDGQLGEALLFSPDGSVIIAQPSPGVITLESIGGGGSGIIDVLHADNGLDASASTVNLTGGRNITTAASGGDTVTLNVSGTTQNAVQVGSALGALTSLPLGTSGYVLTSGGAGSPTWQPNSFSSFSSPFLAFQVGNATNVTGDNSGYNLGSAAPFSNIIYNYGGNFLPGDGAGTACSFVAPATGIYIFIVSAQLSSSLASTITTSQLNVTASSPLLNGYRTLATNGLTPYLPITYGVQVNAGGSVNFNVRINQASGVKNWSVIQTGTFLNVAITTWIFGYRLA